MRLCCVRSGANTQMRATHSRLLLSTLHGSLREMEFVGNRQHPGPTCMAFKRVHGCNMCVVMQTNLFKSEGALARMRPYT